VQFLELSLPVHDVPGSLAWYLALGFAEHETRDIRAYHYAVVGDGHFCIGLHGGEVAAASLSFVRPDVARYVRQRTAEGDQFEFAKLGEDQFNEAALADPDGTLFSIIEARTFSSAGIEPETEPCAGKVEKLALPCLRLEESIEFWQRNEFIVVESETEGMAELHAPGLTVELREGTRQVELIFEPENMQDCMQAVATIDLTVRATPDGHELVAPEGTRLLIRER
jgi:catechol 2,3-dioxygenase-like lactoylglutathione lyase family enzyme